MRVGLFSCLTWHLPLKVLGFVWGSKRPLYVRVVLVKCIFRPLVVQGAALLTFHVCIYFILNDFI